MDAEIIKSVIASVLTALYQPFWFSLILSVLFMYVWKFYGSIGTQIGELGIKAAIKDWLSWFKSDANFRRMFSLTFYTVMILFRTLLNRNMWANPISNVLGVWGLYQTNSSTGERVLTTEAIENLALFIPFAILLLWHFHDVFFKKHITLLKAIWVSTKSIFIFSFIIEFLQLFLRVGTWQLSDLFYNTLVGFIGGLIYRIGWGIKHRGE